jgi:O-acetyl-ADP-ribose deacetylase (regulator of RNase III)
VPTIRVVQGDITRLEVEAVVNAANTSLLGGGGVDGAIHRAAGPELLEACRQIGGCPTGEARITPGFQLPARWVIHTVGPVWRGGEYNEDELLARCYRNSLALADEHDVQTIAFPAISTGAYRFPLERAARIAVREVSDYLGGETAIREVLLVCYDSRTYQVFQQALERVRGSEGGPVIPY